MIEIKRHKGRSGKSAFEWRVYSIVEWHGGRRTTKKQLGKFRDRARAMRFADRCRENENRVAAIWAIRQNSTDGAA